MSLPRRRPPALLVTVDEVNATSSNVRLVCRACTKTIVPKKLFRFSPCGHAVHKHCNPSGDTQCSYCARLVDEAESEQSTAAFLSTIARRREAAVRAYVIDLTADASATGTLACPALYEPRPDNFEAFDCRVSGCLGDMLCVHGVAAPTSEAAYEWHFYEVPPLLIGDEHRRVRHALDALCVNGYSPSVWRDCGFTGPLLAAVDVTLEELMTRGGRHRHIFFEHLVSAFALTIKDIFALGFSVDMLARTYDDDDELRFVYLPAVVGGYDVQHDLVVDEMAWPFGDMPADELVAWGFTDVGMLRRRFHCTTSQLLRCIDAVPIPRGAGWYVKHFGVLDDDDGSVTPDQRVAHRQLLRTR